MPPVASVMIVIGAKITLIALIIFDFSFTDAFGKIYLRVHLALLFHFLLLFWKLLIELSLIEDYRLFVSHSRGSPLPLFLLLTLILYDNEWLVCNNSFFHLFFFPFLFLFAYLPVCSFVHLSQRLIHLDLFYFIYVFGVEVSFFIHIKQLYLIFYEFKLSLYCYINCLSV